MDGIIFSVDSGDVATLTVDRPAVRNALDWEAMRAFAETLDRAAKLKELRALIVTGGGDAFVSGGDLMALAPYTKRSDGLRLATIMGKALEKLRRLPCPSIAALNGPARGGGAEIAVACDLRVMAEGADLAFVHVTLGLIPAWGGARYLLQLVGYPVALELLTTGRVVLAAEAKEIGLVDHVAPPGEALQAAHELAQQLAQHPIEAVRAAKRLLRFAVAHPEAAKQAERRLFAGLWDSEYSRQAAARFLKRNK